MLLQCLLASRFKLSLVKFTPSVGALWVEWGSQSDFEYTRKDLEKISIEAHEMVTFKDWPYYTGHRTFGHIGRVYGGNSTNPRIPPLGDCLECI